MKSKILDRSTFEYWPIRLAGIIFACCSWADVTLAQDPAAAAATDATAAPASSPALETKTPGGATADAAASTAQKRNNAFRTGESGRSGGASKKSPFAYDTGDAQLPKVKSSRNAAELDTDAERPADSSSREGSASRFVASSFYGQSPRVITPGQGQYARPKYRYGISVGIGYDDNPDQTTTVNLAAVGRPRARSGFTNVNGHFDAQWLKPTTVFTVNLEAGGDFYWDRPGNSADSNTRLNVLYVNKIDQLNQLTINASLAYLSQPDYSNIYASQNQGAGDYFTGSTKFDLNHRWTPRFSTTTSASVNLLKYVNDNAAALSSSYFSYVFGNEFRFLASPRLTYVAEGRFQIDDYIKNDGLSSKTAFALGGVDWVASRHLTANFRAGASFRSFDIGGSSSAPYAEVSLNYLSGRHSTLSLNGRYGYEQSTTAGDENLSYRFGLLYQQAFTARFSANTGVNFVHTDYNPRAGAGSSTDVVEANFGVQYRLDRHFVLGARYNYTIQDSSTGLQNFDRNRVLFTVQYEY